MIISQLAREIKESPTLKLNEQAQILKDRSEAVIHLGAGEPKSKVPLDAILTASAKLTSAEIRDTPTEGIPQLLKAVVRYTEENYNRVIGPENIIVSGGAKQSFYNLIMTILNPQEEVIICAPYWVSYPEILLFPIVGALSSLTYISSIFYGLNLREAEGKKSGIHETILAGGVCLGPLLCGLVGEEFSRHPGASLVFGGAVMLLGLSFQAWIYLRRGRGPEPAGDPSCRASDSAQDGVKFEECRRP